MNRTSRVAALLAVAAVALSGCNGAGPGQAASTAASTAPSTSAPTSAATTAGTTPLPTSTSRTSTSPTPTSRASTTASATTRAPAAAGPAVSARARAAGLRDVRSVVPDAVIDLRYATRHNFTGVRLYPRDARCLVHTSMTTGLARAGRAARKAGLRLVFWDCYRPHTVQVRMFRIVPNPTFVARPGRYARSHEAGRSVDVTLARGGTLLGMGTGFDSFTAKAAAFATKGVSASAERNRATLRKIMRAGGLTVYTGEWWHFDGRGAGTNRPHLDAPLR